MKDIKDILTVALLLAFFLNVGLLGFTFSRNDRRRGIYFAMFCASIMFYTLGYLLEIQAQTAGEMRLALCVEHIGVSLVAPTFLMMVLSFFHAKLLRPWMAWIAILYGTGVFLTVFTNEYHRLYYAELSARSNGYFYVLSFERGPVYYIQQGVAMLLLIVTYVLLFTKFFTSSKRVRRQMNPFILGSLFSFAVNFLNLTGNLPLGIDFVPLAMSVGLVFFSFCLYKYKLMDVLPAAFDMAVENLNDVVVVVDNEWSFIYCNQKAKEIFPAIRKFGGTEELVNLPGWPKEICPAAPKQVSFAMLDPVSGREILQQAHLVDILQRNKKIGVSINIRDVTETTHMLQQLEKLALTDPLTGVFNRRHFETLVFRQLEMSRRHELYIGLILLDIDHFKRVNDTYSHLAGDYVLREMVNTLSASLRTHDILGRYGGEEFIIFSIEKDESGLMAFANRMRREVEDMTMTFNGNTIKITVSLGVVVIAPGQSYEAAMVAVDKALYQAKTGGRNQVVLGMIEE